MLKPGTKVHKGEALFPRIDVEKELALLEEEKQAEKAAKEAAEVKETVFTQKDLIAYDDFAKLQLVVAKVLACEKVPKADKLLQFRLKVGNTERTVLSGIAKYYDPASLIGKKVVLLANLAPRKIRGIESAGMLLCAASEDESSLKLLTVDGDMEDGCAIS